MLGIDAIQRACCVVWQVDASDGEVSEASRKRHPNRELGAAINKSQGRTLPSSYELVGASCLPERLAPRTHFFCSHREAHHYYYSIHGRRLFADSIEDKS